ncbi:MAG: hypothetical protein Q8M24_25300 [Pseudolabrys sp.]|nr:hypothetical protein [Pseudolabrys sp.]MDP2298769.1 hypothetical protein [Pseudolabrys sp.]
MNSRLGWSAACVGAVSGAVLMTGAALAPEPALAQCGGTQNITPCISVPRAPQANTYYPRSSGGGYRGGGGRGYSSGGGGGGNYNYAAAVGAANVAIGFLNMAIAAAEEQQRQERNAAARARWEHCQAKYRSAYATNERARRLSEEGRPEEAYALFQRAYDTLGSCGQRADLGKLRGNLESARTTYANLINPDVAGTTIFGKKETGPAKLPPAMLERQAREACKTLSQDTPEWNACVAARKGELVMASDPAIRNACQSIADRAERQQCVFNRYWAGLAGKEDKQFGDPSNCYYDEHGKPCHPGGGKTASAAAGKPGGNSALRDELRRRLDALPDRLPSDEDIGNMEIARDALPPGPERDQLTAAIDSAKAGDPGKAPSDNVYDDYMRGRDGKLDKGQGVSAGVPETGSFANDVQGDKLLESAVPSNR